MSHVNRLGNKVSRSRHFQVFILQSIFNIVDICVLCDIVRGKFVSFVFFLEPYIYTFRDKIQKVL